MKGWLFRFFYRIIHRRRYNASKRLFQDLCSEMPKIANDLIKKYRQDNQPITQTVQASDSNIVSKSDNLK